MTDVKGKDGHSRGVVVLTVLLAMMALTLLASGLFRSAGASPVEANGLTPPAGYKVAFVGDTDNGAEFEAVLNLILSEGADLVLHQGDFDYSRNPTAFFTLIDSILGPTFPYLLSVGNHDDLAWNESCGDPDGCYATFLKARMAALGIVPDDPSLDDQKYGVEYQGLKMVFVGENGNNGEYGNFISDQLSDDGHVWKICSWHRNQKAMQVGGKGNDMSWNPYEMCLQLGAIIATGHEHSYERTKTLVSTASQIVDGSCSDPATVCLGSGRSFVFVSGLGGRDIRNQDRCLPATYPYGCNGEWAKIYTSNQSANYGALFVTFNVDDDPNKAQGYFKTIDGSIIDTFDLYADQMSPSSTTSSLPVAADAYVSSSTPDTNYGTATSLQVDGNNSLAYLKFDLSSLAGEEVQQARLRIKVSDGSIKEHFIKLVEDTSWSETGMTYNNRPASSMLLNSLKGIVPGEWIEIDMSYAVRAKAGQFLSISFEEGGESFAFGSREAGADGPELIVKVSGGEPTVQFSKPAYAANEADGSATVTVKLSSALTQTVTVEYATADGTAVAPGDYGSTSGTLTFNPGETSKNLQVSIVDDDVEEPPETVILSLSNPAGVVLGIYNQAVLTIEDDDVIRYTLVSGTIGNGSMTADPPGGTYDAGSVVTLTATADAGWDFYRWIGDLGDSQNPTTLTMDDDKWVVATFSQIDDILHEATVSGGSSNSTTVSTAGPVAAGPGELYLAAVSSGEHVSVTDVSGLGLTWTSLGEQCAGRGQTGVAVWWALGSPTEGLVTASLASAPKNAVIAVSHYSGVDSNNPIGAVASANTNGPGDTVCSGGTDSSSYSVELTTTGSKAVAYGAAAIADESHTPGSAYIERLEASQGVGSMQIGIAVEDKSVPAPATVAVDGTMGKNVDWAVMGVEIRPGRIEPTLYSLATNSAGSGGVLLNPPGGLYGGGTVVTLTAVPDQHWEFAGWSGDLGGDLNPVTLTMDADKMVTATFSLKQYVLLTTTIGRGSVTLDPGGGVYTAGMTVTLTAVAEEYWEFAGWSGNLSGSANPMTLTMYADKTVTATFEVSAEDLPFKSYLPAILGWP